MTKTKTGSDTTQTRIKHQCYDYNHNCLSVYVVSQALVSLRTRIKHVMGTLSMYIFNHQQFTCSYYSLIHGSFLNPFFFYHLNYKSDYWSYYFHGFPVKLENINGQVLLKLLVSENKEKEDAKVL